MPIQWSTMQYKKKQGRPLCTDMEWYLGIGEFEKQGADRYAQWAISEE